MWCIRFIIFSIFFMGIISGAAARTYYLPDYQNEFIYWNRSQNDDSGQHTSTPSCSTYGYYSAPQNNADCARVKDPVPGLVCYSCLPCSSEYVYSSSNCSGDYITSGSSCGGKYNKCICDRSKFPGSGSGGCSSGQKIDTSASCKGPSDTSTYYECTDDPCSGLISKSICENQGNYCVSSSQCAEGCDQCLERCSAYKTYEGAIECDNGCMNASDQISGCTGLCKAGSTCKPTSCDEGYELSGDTCVPKACPTGTAVKAEDCGSMPNGEFVFDFPAVVKGYSGSTPCFACAASCDSGYATNTRGCGTTPEHGAWTLAASSGGWWNSSGFRVNNCSKCILNCDSGYEASGNQCIQSCSPKDCSSYTLTSIPENASYDSCIPGCGDTMPRYKLLSCNSGYVTSVSSCGRNPTNGSWVLSGSGNCKKCIVSCTGSGWVNCPSYAGSSCSNTCLPSNICEYRAKELGIPNYPSGQGTGGNRANFFSSMSCPCSGSANYCSISSSSHCVNMTTTYGSNTYNCALIMPSGANNGKCKGYNTVMATGISTLEALASRVSSSTVYLSMEAGTISSASGYGTGRICVETSW